jgi:deoxyribonuclease V
MWPTDATSLIAYQRDLAAADPPEWQPETDAVRAGGCWVCFPRGLSGRGAAGDPAWAAAVATHGEAAHGEAVGSEVVIEGRAGAPYEPGLLALRLGPLLEQAVRALAGRPDVLLVDGTSRDHPRRAGLALHLGEVLGLPTIGVTHRPLVARGEWPADRRGATEPLRADGAVVARWVRTRPGTRPLVVHPGWRVDLDTAVDLVLATCVRRTPEPLRRARHAARIRRATQERRTISDDHRGA